MQFFFWLPPKYCLNHSISDAAVDESIQVRIFNRDFNMPDNKLLQLIEEADLESSGYKKSVIVKL